jgi:hypothetical protein
MESVMKHLTVLLALCSIFTVLPVHAANYCVDSNLTLATSLAAAAASNEDDQIRLRTGSYSGIGAIDLAVRGALTISGGWTVSCLLRSETATTTISGVSTQNFKLTQDGNDLELLGLTFSGWSQVILSDVDQQFGPPIDEIRVRRSRFTNSLIGLYVNAGSHNIVVENSRFDGYSDSALRIVRTAQSFGSADVLLQDNTISNPANPNASGLRVQATGGAPAATIRIYNTVMDGNQYDLRISNQLVTVRYSFWTTQLFTAPGGLSAGSGLNLSGDPQLDANYRPIEPDSPLINTGRVITGSTPSTDFDGGPRVFGIRPDIGAYESNVAGVNMISVTNTSDSGAGSLRTAITTANNATGDSLIEFNIPGSCPQLITVNSLLPSITKNVRIEGYSQPGSLENADPNYFDGNVCVFLVRAGSTTRGLTLSTVTADDELYVSGLGFYGFTASAIQVSGPGKAQIRGSLFGTGASILAQNFDDSAIRVVQAPGTVIGGDSVADRNVIGRADQAGIRIEGEGACTVRNNLIGSSRSGNTALANAVGVLINGGFGHVIRDNTIAYNTAQAILLDDDGSPPQDVQILNNYLGASGVNLGSGGNGGNAVRVAGGNGHTIRGNYIYNNQTDGIAVLTPSRRVLISSNRFVNNLRLPIDLSPDGRNYNDLDVDQTGANDRQNFPSLFNTGGQALQGTTRVQLSSANGFYRTEIYASQRCAGDFNSSGYDDAAVLVGTSELLTLTCATSTSNCTDSIVVPISSDESYPLTGKYISPVVWDEENNTSEFGLCFRYQSDEEIFSDGFE